MNRYNKGLPPVTPEICETVALYFSIPTEKEHHLAMQIRMALEAYVDTQYELTVVTKDLVDPMIFLNNMRKEIIKRCVLEKEDPLLMCQECEERSAKLKCDQCKDFFCMSCFKQTRASHVTLSCAAVFILPQIGFLPLGISRRKVNIFWGREDYFPSGLTTFWPPATNAIMGHVRDDAHRDLSDFWLSAFQALNPSMT